MFGESVLVPYLNSSAEGRRARECILKDMPKAPPVIEVTMLKHIKWCCQPSRFKLAQIALLCLKQ